MALINSNIADTLCVFIKYGFEKVPPVVVFQTPPAALPTYIVLGSLFNASIAEILPPITAGPIWRASIDPNVAEEIAGVCALFF